MPDETKPTMALPGEPGKSGVRPTPIDKPPPRPQKLTELEEAQKEIEKLKIDARDADRFRAENKQLRAQIENYLAAEKSGRCPFGHRGAPLVSAPKSNGVDHG